MAISDREKGLAHFRLSPRLTSGARVFQTAPGIWRLEIPAGAGGRYRLAQLDDYAQLARQAFPWRPPVTLEIHARASHAAIPGTWGFGFWNDPFSFSIGFGGSRRLPALPNAAWFFFASPHNYLSLYDDLPAQGNLAATFRSQAWPVPALALAPVALPLLTIPALARLIRRLGRQFIAQWAVAFPCEVTEWHCYQIEWRYEQVRFSLDGMELFTTQISPYGPLGLVIWVDNQYAALPPDGRLKYGTLPNPEPTWIEVKLERLGSSEERPN